MDVITTVALLLHPLLASGLVVWIWWQYAWRKKSYELKGEERALHLARHETNGERLLWATGLVILVAFFARAFTGWYEGGKRACSDGAAITPRLHGPRWLWSDGVHDAPRKTGTGAAASG